MVSTREELSEEERTRTNKVEDLDARGGSGTEPVSVGGEDKGVDDVSGLERVEVLAVVEVPEHGDAILSSGSGERTVGGDGNGVDVTGVTVVVGSELALGELPDLERGRAREEERGNKEGKSVRRFDQVGETKGVDPVGVRDLGDKIKFS
jgi:hypothetical protein